ncbi:MAG TPA: class I SAM-dependent methyltransferase [Gemmataceae bacterium]|jgi:SAM-dependent methyltransferase|nr:class I SAM-dependent methyltransferase [Gemmataceae bacterium]
MSAPSRPNYGLDAPGVVRNLSLIGAVLVLLGMLSGTVAAGGSWGWLRYLQISFWAPGLALLLTAALMIWGSRVGKRRFRDRILDAIPWRGDEQVLDVGCGHGLMLLGAAKRLTTGKAVGIDLWQTEDQAGNSPAATMENARLEGVADRVELKDGDARKLPFADHSFDVILSSWALHNIYDRDGRAVAIREIARVLKPGGRAALVDIRHADEYAEVLRAAGLDVRHAGPNFLFVIPSYTVWANKPAGT